MSLEVKGLYKNYGRHKVLKDISFNIEPGEIVGLIGPNGAGKSTIMKCLCRLVFPTEGLITLDGKNIVKDQEALGKISGLIEAPGLYSELSGEDHLKLYASIKKTPKDQLANIREMTRLEDQLKLAAGKYSMGMKQRLGLAITLLGNPEYLVLDEPFVGLDPEGVFELRENLLSLSKEGKGILVSSHQLLDLEKITSRNIFIKKGEVITEKEFLTSFAGQEIFFDGKLTDEQIKIINGFSECKTEIRPDSIFIETSDGATMTAFLGLLIHAGVIVRRMNPYEDNLESLYKRMY